MPPGTVALPAAAGAPPVVMPAFPPECVVRAAGRGQRPVAHLELPSQDSPDAAAYLAGRSSSFPGADGLPGTPIDASTRMLILRSVGIGKSAVVRFSAQLLNP